MMRKTMLLALVASAVLTVHGTSFSEGTTVEEILAIADHYRLFVLIEQPDEPLRFAYADDGNHVHVYVVKKDRPEMEWETTTMGSTIRELFVADLDGDGDEAIIIATAGGRIVAYDAETYELDGENYQEPFDVISAMTLYNLDDDPQLEIILLADGLLHVYDGKSIAVQWRSQERFSASEVVVANVDDDEQVEIILNTGPIIDSRFYTVEPNKIGSGGYGVRLKLQDLNGDGIPEIIGETPGFPLRIYDVYAQRLVW